jgi:hypothetical protein
MAIFFTLLNHAKVVELVDALRSGRSRSNPVGFYTILTYTILRTAQCVVSSISPTATVCLRNNTTPSSYSLMPRTYAQSNRKPSFPYLEYHFTVLSRRSSYIPKPKTGSNNFLTGNLLHADSELVSSSYVVWITTKLTSFCFHACVARQYNITRKNLQNRYSHDD